MEQSLINSKEDYQKYLTEVEGLAALDPVPGTAEAERLSLLAFYLDAYERKSFIFELPDAVSAIKFRMEEQGLKQSDLIPYIGSKSKVSEVLSGTRPLSLSMIKALVDGLGIPAEVFLQTKRDEHTPDTEFDYKKFPIREMVRRGWLNATLSDLKTRSDELLNDFFGKALVSTPAAVYWRKTFRGRVGKNVDKHSLFAWVVRVLQVASKIEAPAYKHGVVDADFMKHLAKLSAFAEGPLLAREFLLNNGIILVVEPHLPGTSLDGAAMVSDSGNPIIGLTLRHDRLDAFWHNLGHELGHVSKHLESEKITFLDDLESEAENDPQEKEADRFAKDAYIPRTIWTRSEAFRQRTNVSVLQLAKQLGIHPSIVAGRIRFESKNYTQMNDLVGRDEVRKLFKEVQWNFAG